MSEAETVFRLVHSDRCPRCGEHSLYRTGESACRACLRDFRPGDRVTYGSVPGVIREVEWGEAESFLTEEDECICHGVEHRVPPKEGEVEEFLEENFCFEPEDKRRMGSRFVNRDDEDLAHLISLDPTPVGSGQSAYEDLMNHIERYERKTQEIIIQKALVSSKEKDADREWQNIKSAVDKLIEDARNKKKGSQE